MLLCHYGRNYFRKGEFHLIKLRANISVIIFTLSITLLLLLSWNIKSEPSDKCTYLLEDIRNTLDRFNSIKGTDVALKHLIDDLRADLEYSKLCRRPKLFERFAPQGIPVPLVYITNQGFNVHPINALNLATESLLYRGDWKEFHEIMDWMLRSWSERAILLSLTSTSHGSEQAYHGIPLSAKVSVLAIMLSLTRSLEIRDI